MSIGCQPTIVSTWRSRRAVRTACSSIRRHSLMHHNRVLSLGVEFPVLTASVPQHHAIVDAIRRRDVAGTKEAMAAHLEAARRLVMDFLVRGRIRGVAL